MDLHASSANTIQMLRSLADSRARGLGAIRRSFPRFTVLLGLGILPPSFLNASNMLPVEMDGSELWEISRAPGGILPLASPLVQTLNLSLKRIPARCDDLRHRR